MGEYGIWKQRRLGEVRNGYLHHNPSLVTLASGASYKKLNKPTLRLMIGPLTNSRLTLNKVLLILGQCQDHIKTNSRLSQK